MMSEKKQYEKPVLVNCGTMVDQTGCWDGSDGSSGPITARPPPVGFGQFHGRHRGRH